MEILSTAIIYLAAAVLAVSIAKRLGLGSVLGYLIAGIVIGPVLGFVGAETAALQNFAELGVVMMLFVVGLELQPAMLWKMKRDLLGLAGIQVLATSIAIAGAARLAGLEWPGAIAIGMALALSSTAIVLQTLKEKGWLGTVGGRGSFAVLLGQDIAVIPMLAIVPLLAIGAAGSEGAIGGHDSPLLDVLPGWAAPGVVVFAILSIILAGRYLITPVFRFIAETRLREMFTAVTLLLVTGIALLMHAIGLGPALGTFVAGVVLSDSEYRHELENDIEPFKGILLGLFFLTVGAGMDLHILFDHPLTLLSMTVGLMAIKAVILFGIATLFGIGGANRMLFALGLAQAGEFAFVLIGAIGAAHLVAGDVIGMVSLSVGMSMIFTTFLFFAHERWIAPRLTMADQRAPDEIDEPGSVVVAGLGRFGQIVTRLLATNGFNVVILDHDAAIVEGLRKIGFRAYYGDATRPDVLHATGIADARLFIAAIDDRDKLTQLVTHVAQTYPAIQILSRAHDRNHVYELEKAGAHHIQRETFESALTLGREALIALDFTPARADRKKNAFRKHDLETLEKLRDRWNEFGVDVGYLDTMRNQVDTLYRIMSDERDEREEREEREERHIRHVAATAHEMTSACRDQAEKFAQAFNIGTGPGFTHHPGPNAEPVPAAETGHADKGGTDDGQPGTTATATAPHSPCPQDNGNADGAPKPPRTRGDA